MLNIKLIDVLNTIRITMNYLDKDFKNHGDEVSYICYKIGKKLNYEKNYLDKLVVVSMLHDIGACKTDSFKQLLEYDELETTRHSVYSYLFLKHFSPLSEEVALLTLYHHSNINLLDNVKESFIPIDSNLIMLADAISLLKTRTQDKEIFLHNAQSILTNKHNCFKNVFIDALKELENEENILERLMNDSYKDELYSYCNEISYIEDDIRQYLFLLGSSIYFRSGQTGVHSISVYSITKRICSYLNLNSIEKEECEIAAFLHDIGKIVIPSEILKFPGKLSDDDFKIMKKHVECSSEILSNLNNDNICRIASNHHERPNGKGYPFGESTSLSLQDKILAVSDVFGALIEKRYYRDKLSNDEIVQILNAECVNGQLDKDIVDIIINNYDEILIEINIMKEEFLSLLEKIKKEYEEILAKK